MVDNYKKSGTREWIDAAAFAVVAATIIRTFVFEAYTIPTPSMEKTLLVNDFLFVSKSTYGPRIPNTPLAMPFMHHTIPFLNINVVRPEIALASQYFSGTGTTAIFAIIVYYVYNGATYDGYYEIHRWDGGGIWTPFPSPAATPLPNSQGSQLGDVINVAGDEYGHFVIVYDDANPLSTETNGLAGYILNPYKTLMGWPCRISYTPVGSGFDMSEPDVDVTYDQTYPAPYDGKVYLASVSKNGFQVLAAEFQFYDLFQGGTFDIHALNADLGLVITNCISHHPSISVNDGYQAFLASQNPHAAVAYHEACTPPNVPVVKNSIFLFGVQRNFYATSSVLLNNPVVDDLINKNPVVVTDPTDVFAVTAWDFDALNTMQPLYDKEGLAERADYNISNNTFTPYYFPSPPTNGVMQVQTPNSSGGTGFNTTYVTTASGFSSTELLYFYYYFNTNLSTNVVEYKTRPYTSTLLRQSAEEVSDGLSIYPNPVSSSIFINSTANIIASSLSDATGRIINSIIGNNKELETALNKNMTALTSGLYFLKTTFEDGHSSTVKFLKQ